MSGQTKLDALNEDQNSLDQLAEAIAEESEQISECHQLHGEAG